MSGAEGCLQCRGIGIVRYRQIEAELARVREELAEERARCARAEAALDAVRQGKEETA